MNVRNNVNIDNQKAARGGLKKLSRRHNFQPVSVGIFDEVNAHRFVFKADAAHLAVFCVCGFKVIRAESQMKLAFAKIIFLLCGMQEESSVCWTVCGFHRLIC